MVNWRITTALFMVAACGDGTILEQPDPSGDRDSPDFAGDPGAGGEDPGGVSECVQTEPVQLQSAAPDLLLVVDRSGSMTDIPFPDTFGFPNCSTNGAPCAVRSAP